MELPVPEFRHHHHPLNGKMLLSLNIIITFDIYYFICSSLTTSHLLLYFLCFQNHKQEFAFAVMQLAIVVIICFDSSILKAFKVMWPVCVKYSLCFWQT